MFDDTINPSARLEIARNRFPLKHIWDSLALAQIYARRDLSLAGKSDCIRFYFGSAGIRNLFATLTRSGSHWSLLGIAIARDLAKGGVGEYEFMNDFLLPRSGVVYTKLDWREPTGDWDPVLDPAIFGIIHTKRNAAATSGAQHGMKFDPIIFHTHHPYFRLRCARLKRMQVAVVLRSIYDSMESKYFKHITLLGMGVQPLEFESVATGECRPTPTPENEYNFPWKTLLGDAIEFYNSWGDAMKWHPNIRLFRYEDLLAEPAAAHQELTDYWGMDLPAECVEEAFRRITKEEMKKKLPGGRTETTSRLAIRNRGTTMPPARIELIREQLERRLVHDFGYGSHWSVRQAA